MKLHHPLDNNLLSFYLDIRNPETSLNQNLEIQSTRHDLIQPLGVEIGKIIMNSLSLCKIEQVIR